MKKTRKTHKTVFSIANGLDIDLSDHFTAEQCNVLMEIVRQRRESVVYQMYLLRRQNILQQEYKNSADRLSYVERRLDEITTPAVRETVVFGAPDERWGEVPTARGYGTWSSNSYPYVSCFSNSPITPEFKRFGNLSPRDEITTPAPITPELLKEFVGSGFEPDYEKLRRCFGWESNHR